MLLFLLFMTFVPQVNRGPENGSCIVNPNEGYAITTDFELSCSDWLDPEEIGIKHYTVNCKYCTYYDRSGPSPKRRHSFR